MGIIKVETPDGIQKVEIAGDTPTAEEQAIIINTFSPKTKKIDLSTATKEEIRDYARSQRLKGIDPKTGRQITEEEFVRTYKEPGVDYRTGLDGVDGFSRFTFGSLETDEEKANYLNQTVGKEGYRMDDLGRFILTKQGRKNLGMKDGKELAIDEEGFSFSDVKDFLGAAGIPIATGIGATIAASGVGFVPGMLIVGGATAAGKLLDEGIETARGLQRQSIGDVARDTAYEGIFGAFGEGFGRGLSRIFGRIIKGPGGEANEALRAKARQIIADGYRPTIAGATDESFRPILGRLQAVYEGVFPNKTAADVNLKKITEELSKVGFKKSEIDGFSKIVQKDIDTKYATTAQNLEKAQLDLDRGLLKELEKIMKPLKEGKQIPRDLTDMIKKRKAVFDEDMDRLYSKVNQLMGDSDIIATETLKDQVEKFANAAVFGDKIRATSFYKNIQGLGKRANFAQINKIKRQADELAYTPEFLGSTKTQEFTQIQKSIKDALDLSEIALARIASKKIPMVGLGDETLVLGPDQAANALNLLSKTNSLYNKGMKRFSTVTVNEILGSASNGKLSLNNIMKHIVKENEPEALDELFKAIRGIPVKKALGAQKGIIDLDAGKRMLDKQMIAGKPISQIREEIADLAVDNPTRVKFERLIRRAEEDAVINNTIRGTGAEMADEVRQGLAKLWLQEGLDSAALRGVQPETGIIAYDPLKLSSYLLEKGKTVNKLFGKDIDKIENIAQVLSRTKSELSENTIKDIMDLPLGPALTKLQKALQSKKELDANSFVSDLKFFANDPDILAQKIFQSKTTINEAKDILSPQAMEGVRDAAMGKILQGMGATISGVDDAGRPIFKLADDFVENFKSGKLGDKLKKSLQFYGKDTINTMFDNPQAFASLDALSDTMIQVSNRAMAGKGGLAAPSIAVGLGLLSILASPFAALTTAAGYSIASKALRDPRVLKAMMASRRPNTIKQFLDGKLVTDDPVGQGFQTILALTSTGIGRTIEATAEEAAPTKEAIQQTIAPVSEAIEEVRPQLASQASNALKQVEQDKLLGIN
jgi:hypothetical protein